MATERKFSWMTFKKILPDFLFYAISYHAAMNAGRSSCEKGVCPFVCPCLVIWRSG